MSACRGRHLQGLKHGHLGFNGHGGGQRGGGGQGVGVDKERQF